MATVAEKFRILSRILPPGDAAVLQPTEPATVANPAAMTATANAPAGGTGTAAGGWDTAANRNSAITTINNLRADVIEVRGKLDALITELKAQGIIQ